MSKSTATDWKGKAIGRSLEIRKLRKQLSEVKKSRDKWRVKYMQQQQAAKAIREQKPAGHTYPTALVWLCLYVYNHCQCSLRSCSTLLYGSALLLNITCRKPSASTVRNWVIKCGYYRYQQPPCCSAVAGKWCLIIDESVSIGQEKLLLVLGVALQGWKFERPLAHGDVHVLHIGIAPSWKAETIAPVLEKVSKKVAVAYCLSDKGNNIKAAIHNKGWLHIYDCTHEWANYLELCYEGNEQLHLLLKELGMLRKKWVLSRYAHLMPPAQRTKCRFHNIFPLIEWIEKIERCMAAVEAPAREALLFLKPYRQLIEEWVALKAGIGKMAAILKASGMSTATLQACKTELQHYCTTENTQRFSQLLQQGWGVYASILQDTTATYICCSDVIESWFGKFKQKIKPNGMQAITETVLAMSMWGQEMSQPQIETALENVGIKKINEWKQQHTTASILKKRTAFFGKKCTKMAA